MQSGNLLTYFLRATAIVFVLAGTMHVALGLGADQMLGAQVSNQTMMDAGLDSQNRFYGATFTLYGVIFLMTAANLARYLPLLKATVWVFFIAGLVRFISVWLFGWPPPLIAALFAAEIILPPLLLLWINKVEPTIDPSIETTVS